MDVAGTPLCGVLAPLRCCAGGGVEAGAHDRGMRFGVGSTNGVLSGAETALAAFETGENVLACIGSTAELEHAARG